MYDVYFFKLKTYVECFSMSSLSYYSIDFHNLSEHSHLFLWIASELA